MCGFLELLRMLQFALKRGGESDHPVGKISFVDLAGSERGADTYDNNRQASCHLQYILQVFHPCFLTFGCRKLETLQ